MLTEVTSGDLDPGSNRPEASGEVWAFLLPDLAPSRAAHVGDVAPTWMHADVDVIAAQDLSSLASDPRAHDLDLLVIDALGDDQTLEALAGRLADGATVVLRARAASGRAARRAAATLVGPAAAGATPVVLAPRGRPAPGAGGSLLAVPVVRSRAAAPRMVLRARTLLRLVRIRAGRRLRRGRVPTAARAHPSDLAPLRPTRRHRPPRGAVLLASSQLVGSAPPAWLERALVEAGVTVPAAAWAIAPPRGYRSQKVLFLLAGRAGSPEWVVKVTQDPRFNPRLDAEVDALQRLAASSLADPGTVPEVVGTAEHAGLRIAVETAWVGRPFRELSTADPDCPFAARALEWFTRLGERSATADPRPRAARLDEISHLITRYEHVFDPPDMQRARLRELTRPLADEPVPTVFFHGDPGNWNLRARPDGTVGVLDWENAHPAGPPVWDIALFLTTFGDFVAQARGRRTTPATFAEQFRAGSGLRPLIDRTLLDYGRRVGVGREATSALLVLCWVHQALKEASRRPVGAATGGHQYGILQRILADPSLVKLPAGR